MREVGAWIWIRDREQGYHNKREATILHGRIRRSTREQQSHTEEHERIRRIARGANNIVETAATALVNVKVIRIIMSAFRPSFCLNGSFAKFLVTDSTHTGPITLPLRKRGVIIWGVSLARMAEDRAEYTLPTAPENAATLSPAEARGLFRINKFHGSTTGFCAGYLQANVAILPKSLAQDFGEFCRKNHAALPLLYCSQPGEVTTTLANADSNIR